MRSKLALVLGTTLVLLTMQLPALAVPPEVVIDDDFTVLAIAPPGEFCPFEVQVLFDFYLSITRFFNPDGSLDRATALVRGTAEWSGPGGVVSENWAYREVLDPEAGTFTRIGNVFNIHDGAGGILVNESGRLLLDLESGEVIALNGPHQAWEGDYDAMCEAIG